MHPAKLKENHLISHIKLQLCFFNGSLKPWTDGGFFGILGSPGNIQ